MDEEDTGRRAKFARCIICNDYSLRSNCYNIFNTTLKNGQILLSEFLKNVLDCSVFIVVSPDFFICKRCFSLCHNLDYSLARCNDLQGKIQTLFKNTEQKQKILQEGEVPEEVLNRCADAETDIKEEELEGEPLDEAAPEFYSEEEGEFQEGEVVTVDKVIDVEEMDPNFFVSTEVVESEVTIGETNNSTTEEYNEYQSEIVEIVPADKDPVEDKNQSQDYMLVCEVCGLCFENEEMLSKHKNSAYCKKEMKAKVKAVYEFQNFSVKLKKKKKVFFCNRCKYETISSTEITEHVKSHKTDPEYMCELCGRRFKFFKTFTRHQRVHDESRPFACKHCAFRAMTEVLLRIHERQHDDLKKYTCSKCGYKTLKKMSYLIHVRTHTGERPYCCPTCPYKAKDPSTLERHRRIHGGIKRYHCTVCEFKSVQKSGLTIHMMTHTGEKPWACDQCDYRSNARHNLKAHIAAIHSDEKPFACTQCSYRTKLKRLLTLHMRKHTDEKPFSCPYCDGRFRYRSALSYHLNKKHPVDQNGAVQTYYVLNYCESTKLKFNGEDLVFSDDADSGSENEVQ